MPTRNCQSSVGRAIASIQLQSVQDWELLICDDGSTDATREVALSFADSRIVLWRGTGQAGLAARLNECVARACGRYMARMDGDDISYPDRLRKQLDFMEENRDIDVLGTAAMVFGRLGRPVGTRRMPRTHEEITAHAGFRAPMIHPSWFGRIEWFRKYRYSLLASRCEDHELLFRARAGSRYANLPDVLVGYYEDRIDMRTMLASRYNWIRSLVGQRGHAAISEVAVGSMVTAAKVVVDGAGVMARLVHRPLRHRAAPATDDELARWSEIWRSVAGVQEPRASSHSN